MNKIKLPPLPEGYTLTKPWDYEGQMFTEGQMKSYAQEAIEADRQARGGDQTEQKQPEPRANAGSWGGDQRAAFEVWYGPDSTTDVTLGRGEWSEGKRAAWDAWQAALASPEVQVLREALEVIAGIRQCPDNLLGNVDIARTALAQEQGEKHDNQD